LYSYRIASLVLNDGTEFVPSDLTVFIGPNNAGKSQALKDVMFLGTRPAHNQRETVVIRNTRFSLPEQLDDLIGAYPSLNRVPDVNGNWHYHGLHPTLAQQHSVGGGKWPNTFESQFISPESRERHRDWFTEQFGPGLIAVLTTEQRLLLVKEAQSSENDYVTENLLQAFYNAGSSTERRVSDYVSKVFPNQRVALDFTTPRKLRVRIAATFSDVPPDPRDGREIMRSKRLLDDQGDGIRSFVGMVIALETLDRPLILIDEPEAFLHPPQAYAIGKFIAEQTRAGRQILVATHSTDVLRGITSVTAVADIIRIDRVGDTNIFRKLSHATLQNVTLDPLLSSSRVLDGLFYPAAIITEADADNRFFHTVLQKLKASLDLHFVNASNKQTVSQIMAVYSNMGIRRAGIVDFDILRVDDEWQQALTTLEFSDAERTQATNVRNEIAEFMKQQPANQRIQAAVDKIAEVTERLREHHSVTFASNEERLQTDARILKWMEKRLQEAAHVTAPWNELKKHGRLFLPDPLKARFDELFDLCAGKGFFIISAGELESMLAEYGIEHTTNKKEWIQRALQLVPGLEIDLSRNPWRFAQRIADILS
jgi:hypothetical protein